MQKLEGDGLCFVHAGGTAVERMLLARETLHVDTGCVVAFQDSVDFDIQQVEGIKSSLFGVRDCFTQFCRGPAESGCSPFPSPVWRAGYWLRLRRRAETRVKARSWEDWTTSSMETSRERSPLPLGLGSPRRTCLCPCSLIVLRFSGLEMRSGQGRESGQQEAKKRTASF